MTIKKPDLFKLGNMLSMWASKACWSSLTKMFLHRAPCSQCSEKTQSREETYWKACLWLQAISRTAWGITIRESGCNFLHSSREYPPHCLQYFTICHSPSGNSNPFLTMLWFSRLTCLKAQHKKPLEPVSLQSSAWIQWQEGRCSTSDSQVT